MPTKIQRRNRKSSKSSKSNKHVSRKSNKSKFSKNKNIKGGAIELPQTIIKKCNENKEDYYCINREKCLEIFASSPEVINKHINLYCKKAIPLPGDNSHYSTPLSLQESKQFLKHNY